MIMSMATTVTVLCENLSELTFLCNLIIMIVSQVYPVLSYCLNIFTIGHWYAFNHSYMVGLLGAYLQQLENMGE